MRRSHWRPCSGQAVAPAASSRLQQHRHGPTRSLRRVCRGTITAAGTRVRDGIVAADPAVLPLGTTIRVGGLGQRYNRVYHVMDTGRAVRGRQIDVYLSSCAEAIEFGRRAAVVSVVRPTK